MLFIKQKEGAATIGYTLFRSKDKIQLRMEWVSVILNWDKSFFYSSCANPTE